MNSYIKLTNVCKRCNSELPMPGAEHFREVGGQTHALNVKCTGCGEFSVCLFYMDLAVLHQLQFLYERWRHQ